MPARRGRSANPRVTIEDGLELAVAYHVVSSVAVYSTPPTQSSRLTASPCSCSRALSTRVRAHARSPSYRLLAPRPSLRHPQHHTAVNTYGRAPSPAQAQANPMPSLLTVNMYNPLIPPFCYPHVPILFIHRAFAAARAASCGADGRHQRFLRVFAVA